jgi:hypothetical protein
MAEPVTRELAEGIVHALGIPLYLRNGRLWQQGPGELIQPRPTSVPQPHGAIDKPITGYEMAT